MTELVRNVGIGIVFLAGAARAQTTERVSVSTAGVQGNSTSQLATISADGSCVAFESFATNLVPGDTNAEWDVFLRDRAAGTTERVSVGAGGIQGPGRSEQPAISGDGTLVAFRSFSANLVAGDTNATWDVFVRDRVAGTTERVSVASDGSEGTGQSYHPAFSADGRFVAFASYSTTLVPGDTNGDPDVFLRDLLNDTTERVSLSWTGGEGGHGSEQPALSADGRFVAFESLAGNLVPGDTNGNSIADIFVRDRLNATTVRVSVSSTGQQANNFSSLPALSGDGRYVTFGSVATTLVPDDTPTFGDVFVHDLLTSTTWRASETSAGVGAFGGSAYSVFSGNGRYLAFVSDAANLVFPDTNDDPDVFVQSLDSGAFQRASLAGVSTQANGGSALPTISFDGRFVAFESNAPNLVLSDSNDARDVFVRDREMQTPFTSLCDPGVAGVVACPCANPPSGPERGCDNSSSTGGAQLAASGSASLSYDTLTFTTSGEKPTALSIVLQGNGLLASGAVYGQGVRCAGGGLKRLYNRSAVGGSITAPDHGAGEITVSLRSEALGDPILAAQSRWYLVYYRDPIVLGGCPASSTFNATQTGEVVWAP